MEKKNLIQRIGRTNVGSFLFGVALATGITYTTTHQPTTHQPDKPQETRAEKLYENPFFTGGIYDRIDWNRDGKLNEINVDGDGDGETDEVIVFYRRDPKVTLSNNQIVIYRAPLASALLPDDRRIHIPLPKNLPTSEAYRNAAKKVLKRKGYPSEMIDGFDF